MVGEDAKKKAQVAGSKKKDVVEAVKVTSSKRRSIDPKDRSDLITVWLFPPFSTLFVYLTKKEEISPEVHYQTWLAFGYAIGSVILSVIFMIVGAFLFFIPSLRTILSLAYNLLQLTYIVMWFYSLYLVIQKEQVWDGFVPQIADWAKDQVKKN